MSVSRFAEAEAAFSAGRREDGIRLTAGELERDPAAPDYLLTVWGTGYKAVDG